MDAPLPPQPGRLSRQLAIPLSIYVLVASLALVVWISWLQQRESRQRFAQTASTNAEFMNEVRLPTSSKMAERLSLVLDVDVGFLLPDGQLVGSSKDEWPDDLSNVLSKAKSHEPVVIPSDRYDFAIAPFSLPQQFLVLRRPKNDSLVGLGGWVLAPALILTACCGALVFLLSHRIVRPLTLLTGWLPNLQHDGHATKALPKSVSGRKDEIGQLARSLEEASRRLQEEQELRQRSERLAALGRIATSLAHEIRNPAAAIRMHADLMKHAGEAERTTSIALIGEEVDRITDLVNQWLFVARAAPPNTQDHQLSELVTAVVRRLQPALTHAGVELTTNLNGSGPLKCDRMRIEQVVRNLIVNAIQAMPRGGEITVRLDDRDDQVELTVRDEGEGFSKQALRRFGEPFFSEREGGMGIGLTLAREVSEAHGGRITVENPTEGGAVVRVVLPANKDAKIS